MCFTLLLGTFYSGIALSDSFRREVELHDHVHYFSNFCAYETSYDMQLIAVGRDGFSVSATAKLPQFALLSDLAN